MIAVSPLGQGLSVPGVSNMLLTRERAKGRLWSTAQAVALVLREDPDVEVVSLSGEALPPGAIATGRGETRTMQLGRDLMELHPLTAVTLEVSGQTTPVRLLTGRIRADVAKRGKNQVFKIKTVHLVGTVKGTELEVSAIEGASALSVYEGRVAVKAIGRVGGLNVSPGKTAAVTGPEREPHLGKTPSGGAAAAAKALASSYASKPDATLPNVPADDRGKGQDGRRDANAAVRGSSGGGSKSGDAAGGGSGGENDGGEGGESSEGGESGEGGEGEGGDDD